MMIQVCRFARQIALVAILTFTTEASASVKILGTKKGAHMSSASPRIEQLFAITKTVCFGRFVLDIPSTASVVFGPAEVETPLLYFSGEGDKVAERVAEKLDEIEKDRKFFRKGAFQNFPLFGTVVNGHRPGQKILFGSKDQVAYSVYSFFPIGSDLFMQYVDSVSPENSDVKNIVEIFNTIASKIQIREEHVVPAENGVCVEGGFVPLDLGREKVTLGIRLKEFPDVHMSIEAHKRSQLAVGTELETLYTRGEKLARAEGKAAAYASIKTLRRAPRQLRDWNGYEILFRMPVFSKNTDAHEFRFRSLGEEKNALQPQLDVQFDTGVQDNQKASIKPSITDDEAVALWDRLLGSIRVRQPSDSKRNTSEAMKVPLGQLAPTGGICVQAGWWQSAESSDGGSGDKRYFAVGESFPNVLVYTTPSLWQRLTKKMSASQKATIWRLVSYGEEPKGASHLPPEANA